MTNETIDIASKEMWEKAKTIYLSTLESANEKSQVDRYLSMITSVTSTNGNFIVYTANSYAADYLKDNYSDRLKKCLELVSNELDIKLEFRHDETVKPAIIVPKKINFSGMRSTRVSTFISTMNLNEEYTFDEFVRGPSNSFALAAALAVVKNPGKSSYNPLFIHGGTGLGKTHLMQSIGNEIYKKSDSKIICITAEDFTNEFMQALNSGTTQKFKNKYIKDKFND